MCVFINHGIWSCQFPLWNCRSHLPPDGQRMTTLAGTNPSSTLCDPAVPSLQSHSCVPPGALQVLLHLSGLLLDACERGQTSTARSHTRHSFQKSPRSVSLCPPTGLTSSGSCCGYAAFEHGNKYPGRIHGKGRNIYFHARFLKLPSIVTWPISLVLWWQSVLWGLDM